MGSTPIWGNMEKITFTVTIQTTVLIDRVKLDFELEKLDCFNEFIEENLTYNVGINYTRGMRVSDNELISVNFEKQETT